MLEGDSVEPDSLTKDTGDESWSTINSEDSKDSEEFKEKPGSENNIEESDEVKFLIF